MTDTAAKESKPFEAPHPGTQAMPQWDTGELIDAPIFTTRNLLAMIGPGLVMGASAIGGGEWLAGPAVTAKYGGALLWVATVSIFFQVIYNIEISRYTLYTGEPIFTGKFRLPPHPMFWLVVYLMLDWGSVAPYLAANAAIPVDTMILGRLPDVAHQSGDWWLHKTICTVLYLLVTVPLIFGGKIYNSLKVLMSFKLAIVFGFLLIVGIFFATWSNWGEIVSGLFKFGTVPVIRGEDRNGNGVLDPGEDFDRDGHLDSVERITERDKTGKMKKWDDVDGDGTYDGYNTENVFISLFRDGRWPTIDFALLGVIAGLASIAGNGGLTNTPISNFTRDQGWGMGDKVGAIPSVFGGHGITLSHVGCVFEVNDETLPRWRRWVRHICRDQLIVWMGACLIGVSLPSILSVGFLPRKTEVGDNAAAMTAGGVQRVVTSPPSGVLVSTTGLKSLIAGPQAGKVFWGLTLFCGFLVLITSQTTTMDGFVRRWVDVIWTASPRLRQLDTSRIRDVYFTVLCIYAALGLAILWLFDSPLGVFKLSTTFYNLALGFSCWHTIFVNTVLLPRQLRPAWHMRGLLFFAGCYFIILAVLTALQFAGVIK